MKRRNIYVLIFVISVIGLVVIQYQYLRIGLNLANVRFNQDMGKSIKAIQADLSTNNELTFLVGKALTNDDTYFKTGLDSLRGSSNYFLHDFLAFKLLENGIKKEFSYKLFANKSPLHIYSTNFDEQNKNLVKYRIQLKGYLSDLVEKNVVLEIQFSRINNYFLSQLNGLTIPSLLFLAAIIFVVIWVLRSFYWQQNIITRTNDFINNLTHELKTPVFSIGLATKILQKTESEESKKYVDVIRSQNERLKELIEKVLELSKIENKNIVNLTKVDFHPYLYKLCEEFKAISIMEDVEFNYKIKDDTFNLKCEPTHLENTLNNLLDNAKKYSLKSPKKIMLTSEVIHNKLQIIIKDQGVGITKKDQNKIFKKHYRVVQGDLHNVKGYGLGLSYVKKIIKLHKGKINLESKIGEGTIITIKLPIVS